MYGRVQHDIGGTTTSTRSEKWIEAQTTNNAWTHRNHTILSSSILIEIFRDNNNNDIFERNQCSLGSEDETQANKREEDPNMFKSPLKKRKGIDDNNAEGTSTSRAATPFRPSKKNSIGTAKIVNQDFIDRKKAQYHYEVRPINEQLLKDFSRAVMNRNGITDNIEDVIKTEQLKGVAHQNLLAENNRILDNVRDLYNRPVGDVVAMGQDDALQLGQVKLLELMSADEEEDGGFEKEAFYPPIYVKELKRHFIQVAAGGMHSVALSNDGNVYTWGCCDDGPLGRLPSNFQISGWTDRDQCIPGIIRGFVPSGQSYVKTSNARRPEDGQIVSIAAGDTSTLFLSFSGNVYMTGMYKDCDSGKFADPRPTDDVTEDPVAKEETDVKDNKRDEPPKPPPHHLEVPRATPVHCWRMPKKVKKITCGHSFNAAILSDDTLVTWGMGQSGELARSAGMTSLRKEGNEYDLGMKLTRDKGTKSYKHDIINDKFLKPLPPNWYDDNNNTGNSQKSNTGISSLFSSPLSNPRRIVTNVACGGFHILVAAQTVGSSGGVGPNTPSHSQLYSSGLNNYGQLGHGDTTNRHELTLVKRIQHVNINKLAAGEHHSLALDIYGKYLYAFGRSDYGQLGLFDKQKPPGFMVTSPEVVPFPKKKNTNQSDKSSKDDYSFCRILDIDAGDRHSIAITSPNNEVYTWGFGETGSTGHTGVNEDDDIHQPRKLCHGKTPESNYGLIDDKNNTVQKVLYASGGGQHTLMITKGYRTL